MAQNVDRFEEAILPYLTDAYTLARYLLRDEHDAQDAVQDAALRAFRHFDGFRGGDARPWFMTIVRNCCMTARRQRLGDRATEELGDEHVDESRPVREADADAIEHSERAALARAVGQLPVEFREVIVLREIQGMSYAEISEVTGVPIGTTMSRLSRARRRLAVALSGGAREAS
jgi:RNA polymerase sigma-70 factor (ECF subfamily)